MGNRFNGIRLQSSLLALAAVGVSGVATAGTFVETATNDSAVAPFALFGISSEAYVRNVTSQYALPNFPTTRINGVNPSRITLDLLTGDFGQSVTGGNDYYFVTVDGAGNITGFVTTGDNTATAQPGVAQNGQIVFETGVAGGTKVEQGAGDVDLTNNFLLAIVNTMPVIGDIGNPVDTLGSAVQIFVPSNLTSGTALTSTIADSSSAITDSTDVATLTPEFELTINFDLDDTIDVSQGRQFFASFTGDDTTQAQFELDNVMTPATFLAPTAAAGDIDADVVIGGMNQGIASLTQDGTVVPFMTDSWDYTDDLLTTPVQNIEITVNGNDPLVTRNFTLDVTRPQSASQVEIPYAVGLDFGTWVLNGHQAFVPFFPTANTDARLRVTNQSAQSGAITLDAWDAAGNRVATNVQIGTVAGNDIVTFTRQDIVGFLSPAPSGNSINLVITTNAPQGQVMVTGFVFVPNASLTDLPVYNGVFAPQRTQ